MPLHQPVSRAFQRWRPSGKRGVPFAPWLTFSSKSPFPYDNWSRDVVRPYQLVLMPGYKAPEFVGALRNDCDLIRYDKPVSKPTIVWDGFDPLALVEVAYEAFRMDLVGPYFKIRDVVGKCWYEDPRSAELMALRPRRQFAFPSPVVDPGKYQAAARLHRRALCKWSYECMVKSNKAFSENPKVFAFEKEAKAWSRIHLCYGGALNSDTVPGEDNAQRRALAEKLEKSPSGLVMSKVPYKSSLTFLDLTVDSQAHRVFEPVSKREVSQAQQRIESRREAMRASELLQATRSEREKQPSFWGRIFGV